MERSISSVKKRDRIENREIRNRIGVRYIGFIIKNLKFKYAGHITRGKSDKWVERITECTPYDKKRRKSRPRTRWKDEIRDRVGIKWMRAAEDKNVWRKIGEAYAHQWVM